MTVGPHYEQAWTKLLYMLQQNVGWRGSGNHIMQLERSPVRFQEIAGKPGKGSGFPAFPLDTQHVNRLITRQAQKIERLQRMRDFSSPSIRYDDTFTLG